MKLDAVAFLKTFVHARFCPLMKLDAVVFSKTYFHTRFNEVAFSLCSGISGQVQGYELVPPSLETSPS